MGMYCFAEVQSGYRTAYRVAAELSLPEPKRTSDCAVTLDCNDIRTWINARDDVRRKLAQDLIDINMFEAYTIIVAIMAEHASHYIYETSVEADKQGLSSYARLKFFRKKSKQYEFYWA